MGLLNLFSKREADATISRLPSGSFTVDSEGRIVTSTLPQAFSGSAVKEISQAVLTAFRGAQKAQMPLHELSFNYAALKITAKELRGGAIIFLAPQTF